MNRPIIATLLLTIALWASAADFNSIIDEVVSNNPSIKTQRAELMSANMARIAANTLEPAEIDFEHLWPHTKGEKTKTSVGISQSFEWPGVYGVRRNAAKAALEAGNERLHGAERTLRVDARRALFAVVDANLRCNFLERLVSNLESLHQTGHRLLDAREITEIDHRKMAIEEVSIKQELADAETERSAAYAALAKLNGGTLPQGAIGLAEYPQMELLPLADYINAPAPEIDADRTEARALRLDAEAARMSIYPGFSVGYAFAREDGVTFNGFSLGVRLPSYNSKQLRLASALEADARELQAQEAEAARRAEITSTHAAAEKMKLALRDYEHALGDDYEGLLLRALNAGQLDYSTYCSELHYYLTARLEYLTRTLRYHLLVASLPLP